jgi:hypothetical protein
LKDSSVRDPTRSSESQEVIAVARGDGSEAIAWTRRQNPSLR